MGRSLHQDPALCFHHIVYRQARRQVQQMLQRPQRHPTHRHTRALPTLPPHPPFEATSLSVHPLMTYGSQDSMRRTMNQRTCIIHGWIIIVCRAVNLHDMTEMSVSPIPRDNRGVLGKNSKTLSIPSDSRFPSILYLRAFATL